MDSGETKESYTARVRELRRRLDEQFAERYAYSRLGGGVSDFDIVSADYAAFERGLIANTADASYIPGAISGRVRTEDLQADPYTWFHGRTVRGPGSLGKTEPAEAKLERRVRSGEPVSAKEMGRAFRYAGQRRN